MRAGIPPPGHVYVTTGKIARGDLVWIGDRWQDAVGAVGCTAHPDPADDRYLAGAASMWITARMITALSAPVGYSMVTAGRVMHGDMIHRPNSNSWIQAGGAVGDPVVSPENPQGIWLTARPHGEPDPATWYELNSGEWRVGDRYVYPSQQPQWGTVQTPPVGLAVRGIQSWKAEGPGRRAYRLQANWTPQATGFPENLDTPTSQARPSLEDDEFLATAGLNAFRGADGHGPPPFTEDLRELGKLVRSFTKERLAEFIKRARRMTGAEMLVEALDMQREIEAAAVKRKFDFA